MQNSLDPTEETYGNIYTPETNIIIAIYADLETLKCLYSAHG